MPSVTIWELKVAPSRALSDDPFFLALPSLAPSPQKFPSDPQPEPSLQSLMKLHSALREG